MAKYTSYLWAAPLTLIGLIICIYYKPKKFRWNEGALEVLVGRLVPNWASGQTIGWMVAFKHDRWTDVLPQEIVHEHVHVKQALRLGLLFIPAYFGSSLIAYLGGKDPYDYNKFEIEAYKVSGHW